ncbi:MAG: D-alanine--D-alanine ligase family protein [Myxococcota bacterium]
MRIAFTHNLQLTDAEEEAEFDSPETVQAITEALRSLGHDVEPVEVSGPPSRTVARLEALAPDLVFNTAEGTRGRFREAFFPALFDRLAIPFTGSDAWVCALTLDKQLTKLLVAQHGVPTPRWTFVNDVAQLANCDLRFPLIVKPNYEGSSMGITVRSVVESKEELRDRTAELLGRFPSGLLVEEFIVGRDVVVPFVEKASPATGGVLEPASYSFDESVIGTRRYQLYDYELKTSASEAVTVEVPARITSAQREEAIRLSRIIFRALGIRDAGRIDFRLAADGNLYFLEVNALPSLEQGASIFLSSALAGLDTLPKVIGAIVENAAERHGLRYKSPRPRRRNSVRVGLTYNLRRKGVSGADGVDTEAEYDTQETVEAVREAIASYGHDVVTIEATPELPALLPAAGVDVVFNMAEGIHGRFREAQVPALVELLGLPYTGSDPTALSLCLDKALAKRLVSEAGLRTAPSLVMHTGKERLPRHMTFPLIIKPLAEGSSKGILDKNVVEDELELRTVARKLIESYRQPVLVETFLPGREFTVALLGERKPRILPPMEIVFLRPQEDKHPVYSFSSKFREVDVKGQVPAAIDEALRRDIERLARGAFTALGCRDVARIDIRCDREGRPHFIECNPLPGLSPGFSDLCIIAEAAGLDYRSLIGEILAPALRRLREKRREKLLAGRLL